MLGDPAQFATRDPAGGDPAAADGRRPLDRPGHGRPRKFAYPPNLVVVDGGPPQVAAAAAALDELGIDDVAVCGLAKRLEEVWLPGEHAPVILPRTSEGLYLLQRVRDEAHRFAITYHRQKRSKAMTSSALDDGAGPRRDPADSAARHFGSVRSCARPTVEEIAEVPGHRAAHRRARSWRRWPPGQRQPARPRQRGHRERHEREPEDRPGEQRAGRSQPMDGPAPRSSSSPACPAPGAARRPSARGPRLVRRRQPAARADARPWSTWRCGPTGAVTRIAVVMDVRSRAFTTDLRRASRELDAARRPRRGCCSWRPATTSLVRRFESVRRRTRCRATAGWSTASPPSGSCCAGCADEADLVLDTSALTCTSCGPGCATSSATGGRATLRASVVSFGYKYGLPVDADLVVDCGSCPTRTGSPSCAR